MNKIRIIIADDHSMLRYGLKQIIDMEKDMEVVALASDGDEIIRLANQYNPDIILMDINMPNINGLQATEILKKQNNPAQIIVLTIHHDRDYLFKALNIGAKGYILKDSDPAILLEAIRNIFAGETYIQPNMTKDLIDEFNRIKLEDKIHGDSVLTPREIEVLELIAKGMSNKEIALSLGRSEKTIKNHISSIFRKIDVYDRTQAAIYALKHHIAE